MAQVISVISIFFLDADTGVNEDSTHIEAGKDFALIRTGTGKVSMLYFRLKHIGFLFHI